MSEPPGSMAGLNGVHELTADAAPRLRPVRHADPPSRSTNPAERRSCVRSQRSRPGTNPGPSGGNSFPSKFPSRLARNPLLVSNACGVAFEPALARR